MAENENNQQLVNNEGACKAGTLLTEPFAHIGEKVIGWINVLGTATIFLVMALWKTFRPKQFPKVIAQIYYIGASSITIIMLVSVFTGMVLGLQSYHALSKFGAVGGLGALVSLSLIRELGPVLTAIMITARAGSAITAEVGIQRISEQVDALQTMRIDPFRYLISPRITAAIISFPLLTAIFDFNGIIGGYISAVMLVGLNAGVFFPSIQSNVGMKDLSDGFLKAIVFAGIVATVCFY
jgi:phospholipid/cholesterol/gamma-HCH transport system permease protein